MKGTSQRKYNGEPRSAAVLAVVVLYRMRARQSLALQSLLIAHRSLDVLLWDNSPNPEPAPPTSCQVVFHADPTNPGLAAAYNAALAAAAERGIPWLLLLDQDTEVTPAFLDEVCAATERATPDVVGFVPLLRHRGTVVSPFTPRLAGPNATLTPGKSLQAFNSGAVLRVATLTAMGGFDPRFPLDYLDHATFAALQRKGRVQVLQASLKHALSTDTGQALSAKERARQQHILAAERRFYRLHGSTAERLLHPIRLLRRAASVVAHKRDFASARQILRSALPGGEDFA